MKIEYKYIHFEKDVPEAGNVWWCYHNKTDERLGMIKWNGKWDKYTFHPEPRTFFDSDCEHDIGNFLEQLDDQSEAGAH